MIKFINKKLTVVKNYRALIKNYSTNRNKICLKI